ncbi:MAG TPA: hypothetical protein VGF67_19665 [Ktedonobacteraceae bacterium]|jgi:SRSO17 transposase
MAGTLGSIRRPLDATAEPTFSLVFAAPATTAQAIVTALGGRWRIEEDWEHGKDRGLDHAEGRRSLGWSRHYVESSLRFAPVEVHITYTAPSSCWPWPF